MYIPYWLEDTRDSVTFLVVISAQRPLWAPPMVLFAQADLLHPLHAHTRLRYPVWDTSQDSGFNGNQKALPRAAGDWPAYGMQAVGLCPYASGQPHCVWPRVVLDNDKKETVIWHW
jgi:hypothetical protein